MSTIIDEKNWISQNGTFVDDKKLVLVGGSIVDKFFLATIILCMIFLFAFIGV